VLYEQTGRWVEWARLVDELVPDLTDPAGGGPRPGLEEEWRLLTGSRVRLASETRDLVGAVGLQRTVVGFNRERAAPFLDHAPETLDSGQRNRVRSLAASLQALGALLVEHHDWACVQPLGRP
jgi:hypothetical protein